MSSSRDTRRTWVSMWGFRILQKKMTIKQGRLASWWMLTWRWSWSVVQFQPTAEMMLWTPRNKTEEVIGAKNLDISFFIWDNFLSSITILLFSVLLIRRAIL